MAAKKIETLTKEQEDLIPVVRDFWLDYLLSCKHRTNKEEATRWVEWMYSFCGENKPSIIFMDSPLGCIGAANFLKNTTSNIRANIGDNIRDNIWDNIVANIGANIRDNIGANIGANIWDNIGANIRDNIWDNIVANIGANIRDNIGANIGDNTRPLFSDYGNISDYSWVAYMDYFFKLGLIRSEKEADFNVFKNLLLSGVYDMIQFKNVCIVCDMPTKISRDGNGRLHDTNGHAVQWADGFGMHFIHGRFVDAKYFEKCAAGHLRIEEYLNEENDELRSMAYEIIGPEKMLSFLRAEIIDECSIIHKNGEVEKISLYRTKENMNRAKNEPYAWIKRVCPSTGTTYLTPTNPAVKNAMDAAKFHRPDFVPMSLDYSWYSRS